MSHTIANLAEADAEKCRQIMHLTSANDEQKEPIEQLTSAAGFAAAASPSPVNADVLAPAPDEALAGRVFQNADSTVLLGRIGLDAAIGESGDIGKGQCQRNGNRRPFAPACMEAVATHCLPGWMAFRRTPARPSPAQGKALRRNWRYRLAARLSQQR